MFADIQKQLITQFSSWPNAALSAALVAVAIALVVIALTPAHPVFKAITLAYVILP